MRIGSAGASKLRQPLQAFDDFTGDRHLGGMPRLQKDSRHNLQADRLFATGSLQRRDG